MTKETILTDDNIDEHVICPQCANQFRAIPVQVQQLLIDAGYKPPFKQTPPVSMLPDKTIEDVTKAILFEDCGSTEDWRDNINLGQAAITAVLQSDQVQAWKRDAERYRKLKSRQDADDEELEFAVIKNVHFDLFQTARELEAAIDAAMEQQT